jgi:trans-aconitate methyltransferase
LSPTTSVVEIGCGYGGQAAVLNRMFGIRDYTCFDLPPVLELIERYLVEVSDLEIRRGDLAEKAYKWDLVISNYAFSELRRDLQIHYMENILLKSASGFMIMNSGLTNKTGRSTGKLTITEIREFLPNLRIVEETPLTGPDNYVILW